MNFTCQKILSLIAIVACSISPLARAQDPVDQQVSPEVKSLEAAGAKEDAASRREPTISQEVKRVDAAGAKEDASAWNNLAGFIQQKTKDGLHGKALADAVKGERQRLGLTGLSTANGKNIREFERAQERIEQIDKRLVMVRARLASGFEATGNSNVRSMVEKEQKQLESEKEQLEKRSTTILESLSSGAKF